MHQHIQKLYKIATKKHRRIIGLMSGTSLDGLDIAVCNISGHGKLTKVTLEAFATIDYCHEFKSKVRRIFSRQYGSIEDVCLLNAWIGDYHAKLINQFLLTSTFCSDDIDIIASHGQTIYHCPIEQHQISGMPNATLQIGDGDQIAVKTNIITLSDFRQKHIAAGGQGAPLVMYGDYLLFHVEHQNRVLLNIGGIANLTYLPKSGDLNSIFSSDIGPGNTMMDGYIQSHFPDLDYDKNAKIATTGKCHTPLLNALKSHAFFNLPFPKTTGPEVFNLAYLKLAQDTSGSQNLSVQDLMATLCQFSADTIVDSIDRISKNVDSLAVYVSGGGMHNPLLMQMLDKQLSELPHVANNTLQISLGSTDLLEINPDAKEAVLFALLANETLCGDGKTFISETSKLPSVSMGKISFPD